MKKLLSVLAVAFASQFALAPSALAVTPQQQRMKDCNAEAKGKTGDERKAFMKGCLTGKKAEAKSARTAQQEKMKACNVDAKGKKGAERKAFMKECLSK